MATKKEIYDELKKYLEETDLAGLSKNELESLLTRIEETRTNEFSKSFLAEQEAPYRQRLLNELTQAYNREKGFRGGDIPGFSPESLQNFSNRLFSERIAVPRPTYTSAIDSPFDQAYIDTFGNTWNIDAFKNLLYGAEGSGVNINQDYLNFNPTQPDLSAYLDVVNQQLNRIQDTDLENYLNEDLPNALTQRREDFLAGEAERAKGLFLDEIVPLTEKEANIRGLTKSGYIPTMLSSRAGDIQAELDTLRATAEAEDFSYLADAAYRNKVRQLIEGQQDYRSALLSERNNQLIEQGQRFQSQQSEINRKFQEEQRQRQYEIQLKSQEAALQRQNQAYQRQQRSSMFGSLGQSAGAIIGAAYGGPVGGAVGSQAGGNLGGMVKG